MSFWKTFSLTQNSPDYLDLVQLTDTHILASATADFDGVDTCISLKKVIAAARQDDDWPVDAVLLTGDLVHETELNAYRRLKTVLSVLTVPVFCLAGNHDEPELMHAALLGGNIHAPGIIDTEYWQIMMLNSYLPDTHSGHIDERDLEQLDRALEQTDKAVLVCLHHPPVSVQSSWMDSMRLDNPDALFAILDQHKHVRCILWGHIHQEFVSERKGVSLLASPSTCVQFMPGSDRYIKDDKPPAYRKLRLYASGRIDTTITRVKGD